MKQALEALVLSGHELGIEGKLTGVNVAGRILDPLAQKVMSAGRLPPGQSLTRKWPVLHYGSVPRFDPERWDCKAMGWWRLPCAGAGWSSTPKGESAQQCSPRHALEPV